MAPASYGAATTDERELAALCALNEPTRRRLYDHVASRGRAVTRDEVSEALDIDRSLVAYHLDRLVERGLLEASFARPEGRGGPGAGRPAKRYERAVHEFTASAPPRNYRLAAEVLVRAAAADPNVRDALERAAARLGREVARGSHRDRTALRACLDELGFEPYTEGGATRLRNCPFRRLAREHTELVCGMNLALLTGLADALGAPAQPRLEPDPERCCVVFGPR